MSDTERTHQSIQARHEEMYGTYSLQVAAFIVARGFAVRGLEPTGEHGRKRFLFDAAAEAVATEFFQGGLVGGKAYIDTFRQLRSLVLGPLPA